MHNGKPIKRNDTDGLKRVAQYIIRNPFSAQKMTYSEGNGTVIYRSTKRKFSAVGGSACGGEKILRHLGLWPREPIPARAPPGAVEQDWIYDPVLDDYQDCDEAVSG